MVICISPLGIRRLIAPGSPAEMETLSGMSARFCSATCIRPSGRNVTGPFSSAVNGFDTEPTRYGVSGVAASFAFGSASPTLAEKTTR